MQISQYRRTYLHASKQTTNDTNICKINRHFDNASPLQALNSQSQSLNVSLQPSMAINFSSKLEWLSRSMRLIGSRMQNRPAITKSSHAWAIEQMGINPCHLLRGVSTQAHRATRQLIDQLERL